jgi:hypothetical protein
MSLRPSLLSLSLLALSASASADSLILTPLHTVDIAPLQLNSVGDLAFAVSASKLWICDGASNGQVYQLNPFTGTVVSQFTPNTVPGLNFGPDALAVARTPIATPDVFVFSSFNESEGGHLTNAGALVNDFGTSHDATGADFDMQGNLWIAAGTTAGGGSTLMRLNTTTGAVLSSVPIAGTSERVVDLAFDPHTGACYCLLESWQLKEVNTSTGAQISTTNLASFVPGASGIGGGITFYGHGQMVFLAANNGSTAGQFVVLERDYATLVCDGTGITTACPCGNVSLPGRGCNNSFNTGGARLTISGVPSVTFDDARLDVIGLPPSAPSLFFQGTVSPESNAFVIDDGLICVSGSVVRLATRNAAAGAVSYPTNAHDVELHVRGQIPASGGTRLYQVWYRNAANFCTSGTSNFTNAIEVLWEP